MAAWVITGDEALVSLELTALVDRLVGDGDRGLIVEEIECADGGDPSLIIDALSTMSLFADRRVVVLRDLHALGAEHHDAVVAAIGGCIDGVDLVVTATAKLPKVLESALAELRPEKVGAAVVSKQADRVRWVEEHLVEAGFTWVPEVPRLIEGWFGGDHARVSGLMRTLVSALGEGAKLTRADVEDFLGDAGRIEPWRLTDPIDAGNTADALVMLHRMLADSHPLQVLGLLANRYAQMMKVDGRGIRTEKEAAEVLGGHPFAAKKILEQQMRLGSANLARAVRLIAEADVDLRGGKDWDEKLVLEVLVARLSRLSGTGQQQRRRARSSR
ncbi:MAG: DNA polymerase III subunit delta [Ilumatobacteraceae bacterium]